MMKNLLMHTKGDRSWLCPMAFNGGWMKEQLLQQISNRVIETHGKGQSAGISARIKSEIRRWDKNYNKQKINMGGLCPTTTFKNLVENLKHKFYFKTFVSVTYESWFVL